MLSKWFGTYFGWDVIITLNNRKDECNNDFQVSATLRDAWCIDNVKKIRNDNKYFIFELLQMRLFELKLSKETLL